MCGGRGLPLPLAMLGEIQLTLPIAARSPAPRPGRRACRTPRRGRGRPFFRGEIIDLQKLHGRSNFLLARLFGKPRLPRRGFSLSCNFDGGLPVRHRETGADGQSSELIDRVASGAPVRELVLSEALGHARMPFARVRADHRAGIDPAASLHAEGTVAEDCLGEADVSAGELAVLHQVPDAALESRANPAQLGKRSSWVSASARRRLRNADLMSCPAPWMAFMRSPGWRPRGPRRPSPQAAAVARSLANFISARGWVPMEERMLKFLPTTNCVRT